MLILVEGPDGVGKSTLVKTLCEKYGYEKAETPPRGSSNYYDNWKFIKDDTYSGTIAICDRSFLTDFVYRLEDGRKSDLSLRQILDLLSGVKVVHCCVPDAFELAMARGEDNIVVRERHDYLTRLYHDVFNMLSQFAGLRRFMYNWKFHPIEDVIKFINRR